MDRDQFLQREKNLEAILEETQLNLAQTVAGTRPEQDRLTQIWIREKELLKEEIEKQKDEITAVNTKNRALQRQLVGEGDQLSVGIRWSICLFVCLKYIYFTLFSFSFQHFLLL